MACLFSDFFCELDYTLSAECSGNGQKLLESTIKNLVQPFKSFWESETNNCEKITNNLSKRGQLS